MSQRDKTLALQPSLPYPHSLLREAEATLLGEMRMAAARHVVRGGETRVLDRPSCSLSDNALHALAV